MIDTTSFLGLERKLQPGFCQMVPPATQRHGLRTLLIISLCSLLKIGVDLDLLIPNQDIYLHQPGQSFHFQKINDSTVLKNYQKTKLPIVKALKKVSFKQVNDLFPKLILFFCPFIIHSFFCSTIWRTLSPDNRVTLMGVFFLKLFVIPYEVEKTDLSNFYRLPLFCV